MIEDKDYLKNLPTASIDDEDDEDTNKYASSKKTDVKSKTPVLDTYSRDLTKMAEEGRIDPIIGRDKEIERVSQILSRRKKNNPILIGEAGGKSAEDLHLGFRKKG
jgi:ATP-dependent Clp protease ATP-binding subunit ClpC